jgi:small basic protein (TIGR04137 family)
LILSPRLQRKKNSLLSTGVKMSQHSSLKGSSKIKVRRNVLKRFERIDLMLKRGIITKENVPASGLPKTKPDE